jgi:hypothetical protein
LSLASKDHKINIRVFRLKRRYKYIFILCFTEMAEQLDTYLKIILDWNILFLTIEYFFKANFKVLSFFWERHAE